MKGHLPKLLYEALLETEPFWVCLNRPEEFCLVHRNDEPYVVGWDVGLERTTGSARASAPSVGPPSSDEEREEA